MKINKINKIENYLKENNIKYMQEIFAINISNFKQIYEVKIENYVKDYVVSKHLNGSCVFEVKCKTQKEVIQILSC